MKRSVLLSLLLGLASQAAMAFPSWMGVYGNYKRHDDRANPGQFSILMNQDYFGLQAEVGIQVNGGNWVMYPMKYSGNVQGNSYWTFTPSFQFPGGQSVKYFFHGYDQWGGHIWDSRNGLNYEFVPSPDPVPVVQRIADGKWAGDIMGNGITYTQPWNLWIDFKVKNIGSPEVIGVVWSWDNWASHRSTSATYRAALDGGFQQWGVELKPAGTEYSHRSLGFIRWFPETSTNYVNVVDGRVTIKYAIFYKTGGTWYWDRNGGSDYSIVIGKSLNPNDTDGDGLTDSWELEYFGNLNQSATGNPDGDGPVNFPMANIIEMLNGTNPNVGEDTSGRGVRLVWANAYPNKGGTVTLSYGMGNQGNPLFGKTVYAHVGFNGWKNVYQTSALTWNGQTGRLDVTINVPLDATEINLAFTDKAGAWDNNGGKDWKILVQP